MEGWKALVKKGGWFLFFVLCALFCLFVCVVSNNMNGRKEEMKVQRGRPWSCVCVCVCVVGC